MKRLFIWIIMFIFLLPSKLYAVSGNITLNCNKNEVNKGETVTCSIDGNTLSDINSFKGKLTLAEGFSVNSFDILSGWTNNGNNTDFEIVGEETVAGNVTLGTFNIIVNSDSGDYEIKLSNLILGNDLDTYDVEDVISNIKVNEEVHDVKGLSSLTISGGLLLTEFKSDIVNYIIDANDGFNINAVAANPEDTIKLINAENDEEISFNNIRFDEFKDTLHLLLYVGTGVNEVIYNLGINKHHDIGNGILTSLNVGGINILENDKYDYEVILDSVTSYQVNATLDDSENYIFNSSLVPPVTLSGERTFEIIIEPKNSSSELISSTYRITVKKKSSDSSTTGSSQVNNNPRTGSTSSIVMGIILILSFIGTLYLYKKNMSSYE